jgi:hypothetical protein
MDYGLDLASELLSRAKLSRECKAPESSSITHTSSSQKTDHSPQIVTKNTILPMRRKDPDSHRPFHIEKGHLAFCIGISSGKKRM